MHSFCDAAEICAYWTWILAGYAVFVIVGALFSYAIFKVGQVWRPGDEQCCEEK